MNATRKNRPDEAAEQNVTDAESKAAGTETVESKSQTENTDSAATVADQADNLSLEEQLAAAKIERDSAGDQLLRTQAELDNYRKRVQKEIQDIRMYQGLPLARDILPGLDNLRRAIQAAQTSGNINELVQGVEMVAKQFEDTLGRHAAVPIVAVGEAFDPNLHEAIQQVPSAEQPPMTVLQEVERGYIMNDRVVRPSKVIVSSAPPETAEDENRTVDVET